MERFDYKELFVKALKEGITLFCGAGFSILAKDNQGRNLPLGDGLLAELKENFDDVNNYSSLPKACTKMVRNDRLSFYSFLEDRFSVKSYDKKYDVLTKISIKSIYTTNIDDLFYKIFENSKEIKKIYNLAVNGKELENEFAIDYYALHGSVREKGDYVFGATELATAFSRTGNSNAWRQLAIDSSNNPILFWGWNFGDTGPIEAMYGNNGKFDENVMRWVLLYKPDKETIDFLETLNFNIIIGDTDEMLQFISDTYDVICDELNIELNEKSKKQLSKYDVPIDSSKLPKYKIEYFFTEYTPQWSHIFSGKIPKTKYYSDVINYISCGCNVIVIGIRCSGKTTLAMQLSTSYKTSKTIHYMVAPSISEVETYIKLVDKSNVLLFVDDCFRDTDAVCRLLSASNIQTVFFDRDFNYERQFHRLEEYTAKFKIIDITELPQKDAQRIVDSIPYGLKVKNPSIKNFKDDPTILNLFSGVLRSKNFNNFLDRFIKQDEVAAKVFLVVCYVHSCGVPCSFDMIYSFLGDDIYSWEEMFQIINRIGGLINDLTGEEMMFIDYNQDYYICRSRIFAERIISSLPNGFEKFREILFDFTEYVPQYKICQYDKFRRSAYDADIVAKAFGKDIDGATKFFELCTIKDDSEYIFQQAALYFAKLKDYTSAFYWIDKAKSIAHYNRFSIQSTYAQIYFDANFEIASEPQLIEALNMLKNCCTSDKRKNIHFIAFVDRAISYYDKYHNDSSKTFLQDAKGFIDEALKEENLAMSEKSKHIMRSNQSKLNTFLKNSE